MSIFESRWATDEPQLEQLPKEVDQEELEDGEIPSTPIEKHKETAVVDESVPDAKHIDEVEQSLTVEKPLPPIPPKEDEPETNGVQETEDIAPPPISKDVPPPPTSRQRTRLVWKGKACWIGLPGAGPESYGRNRPLRASEVESRVRSFEEAGYNTNGFDVESHWAPSAVSQSRGIFPDPNDEMFERQEREFKVRVPNPNQWKEYMDQMLEAKLAALGVSMGDEPAPLPPPLSRTSSGHYPRQSVSPNMMGGAMLPGSHRSTPSLAHFSTAGHSHSASVASPLSMPGAPAHMARHSVFGMPYGFPQQQTAHSGLPAFSPGQHFNMNGVARGGSPALERLRSESVGANKSPNVPFGVPSPFAMSRSPHSFDPNMAQLPPHLRNQSVYSSFSPQPASTPSHRPGPALPELREDEEEQGQDYFSGVRPESQHTEIIHPSPRGRSHRHNVSEGLERDVQDAEYHLERSIERQMNDESEAHDRINDHTRSQQRQGPQTYLPPAKRASLTPGVNGVNGVNGQTQRAPSPQPATHGIANAGFTAPLQNKLLNNTKGHASRLSVAAPEFKFNPGGAFQPSFAPPPPAHAPTPVSGDTRDFSGASDFSGPRNFPGIPDPQPPAFQPNGFGGFGGSALTTSNFNFSSSVPHVPVVAPAQPPSQSQLPSIFGNVSVPEMIKPAKRSKALVIKAPTAPEQPANEDEHGRIVQSDERQKRARTERAEGNDVPLFAECPETAVRGVSPIMPVPEELRLGENVSSTEPYIKPAGQIASTKDFERLAESPPRHLSERKPSPSGHQKNNSSLSAKAKPFEYNPGKTHSFAPLEPPRTGSPGAHENKPDFSPQRVFSQNVAPGRHDNVESLSLITSPEPHKHASIKYPEPTFDEIDAVMQQLNDDSDRSVFQSHQMREGTPAMESSVIHHMPAPHMRSDAPSPSPKRSTRAVRHATSGSVSPIDDRTFSDEQFNMPSAPAIHCLNRDDDAPISEWSDDLEVDEDRIRNRSRFFDHRIDSIVGNIMQDHLRPLERSLQTIHKAVLTRGMRERSRPATGRTIDSDADDEDDMPSGTPQYRPLSSGNDKRAQQIKAAVLEAFSIQEANIVHAKSPSFSSAVEIQHAIMDMNTTIARIAGQHIDLEDVKAVVEDVFHRQARALIPAVSSSNENNEILNHHRRQLTELEGRFNDTLVGKLEEANQRRLIEEREADTRRLLRLAEEELSLLRDEKGDQDYKIQALQREFQASLDRAEQAEAAKRDVEKQLVDVESENSAFESTLEEYRMSSNSWRQQVDELSTENENLRGTVAALKSQIADGLNIRENMRGKLDKIHADMAGAAEQLANEKSTWQTRNEELQKKNVLLQARLDGEVTVRRSFEDEVHSLRNQVHEGVSAKIHLEHALRTNATYEDTVNMLKADLAREASVRREFEEEVHNLRTQVHEGVSAKIHLEQALRSNATHEDAVHRLKTDLVAEQTLVMRLERDLHEARESGRAEVQRTQMIMESSIDATNSQAAIMRSSLEHELHMAKNAIEDLRMTAETAKARHEMLLEEEADLRRDALRKVNETSSSSLNDLREKHQEALRYMRVQHEKELCHALEDKHRAESYLQGRLDLSNDQVAHLQERVLHLEERVKVARSAAQAAAKQAQEARYAAPAQERGALDTVRSLDQPEKISPQALRESILVLQEQLQERETRIESLQSQMNSLDTTAPAKLKERDTEITWLRELLAVRNEDLSELIRQLEKDGFDREAVRDYAIRISAGIQMEQAEKERLINAGTSKAAQAVAGLANVASPGVARLASAWGSWRKGRTESSSSANQAASAPSPASAVRKVKTSAIGKAPSSAPILRAQQQQRLQQQQQSRTSEMRSTSRNTFTPSKPSPAPSPSIFAGLMTPPASQLRRTPTPTSSEAHGHLAAALSGSGPGADVGSAGIEGFAGSVPEWQQGTVHSEFTQAPPPGFGAARRTSPLSQENAGALNGALDTPPGLFGLGYDSDAEEGALMPEESFCESAFRKGGFRGDDDAISLDEDDMARDMQQDERHDEHEEKAMGDVRQSVEVDELDDPREREEADEDRVLMAEETLGRSLAAELENL
ncbi:hypothetical protein BDV97DRAFT_343240 [Delphinella strobiligena]|nr:hypothetical protein BDV97DRAFT_343240 [Delphinella strobiligena]